MTTFYVLVTLQNARHPQEDATALPVPQSYFDVFDELVHRNRRSLPPGRSEQTPSMGGVGPEWIDVWTFTR